MHPTLLPFSTRPQHFTPFTSNLYQSYAPHLSAIQDQPPTFYPFFYFKSVSKYAPHLFTIQDPPHTFYPFYFKSVSILCIPLVCHSRPTPTCFPSYFKSVLILCTPLVWHQTHPPQFTPSTSNLYQNVHPFVCHSIPNSKILPLTVKASNFDTLSRKIM